MFETLVSKIGFPVLLKLVGGVLSRLGHPLAQKAGEVLSDVETAIETREISDEEIEAANAHVREMARMELEADTARLSEINRSLRAEVASDDPYVRRMRPTFGYLLAVTWAAQMLALVYILIFHTGKAAQVIEAMAALSTIWGVALSVLGIYVYKRSEDKKVQR